MINLLKITLIYHILIDKMSIKNFSSYIEFQIHGIVDLTQDVEKITMSKTTYEANKELVDKFISKYYMIDVIIY